MIEPIYQAECPSEECPSEVTESLVKFESHCRNWPFENVKIRGDSGDHDLLDYCEYETGYPDGDWQIGAHVWANLIVNIKAGSWAKTEDGSLFLVSPLASDGWNRWSFEVLPMFKHYQMNPYAQWGAVDTLTQFYVMQVICGGGELKEVKGIIELWKERETWEEFAQCGGDVFRLINRVSKIVPRLARSNK